MHIECPISGKLSKKCPISNYSCRNKILLWNDKIRSGNKKGKPTNGGWIAKSVFTKNKEKIFKCTNCDVGYLKNLRSHLESNNKLFRNIFDGSNSVKKYMSFNKPRELKKLKKIKNYINFDGKTIMESNCGAAAILDKLKKNSKKTAGLDHEGYRKYIESKGHLFFSNFSQIKKSKLKFDIILSLGEIEHKYNPSKFLKNLKKILSRKGLIVMRIPNYNNIYNFFTKRDFFKYDYRVSHNFYFTEKSIDYFFKKNNMQIVKKTGLHEYSINHLLNYMIEKKRVSDSNNKGIFNKNLNKITIENLENSMISTSLLYVVKRKNY